MNNIKMNEKKRIMRMRIREAGVKGTGKSCKAILMTSTASILSQPPCSTAAQFSGSVMQHRGYDIHHKEQYRTESIHFKQ